MKNLTIRAQMGLCLAGNLVLLAVAGGTAIYLIGNEREAGERVAAGAAEAIEAQTGLTEIKDKLSSSACELLLGVYAKDAALTAKARGQFAGALSDLRQSLDKIRQLRDKDSGTRAMDLSQLSDDLSARVRDMERAAMTAGPEKALSEWKVNVLPQTERLNQGIHDLASQSRSDLKRWAEESTSASGGRWLLTTLLVAGLAMSAAGWFINTQSTNSLSKLAWQIQDGAEQVAGASGQVAGASQSLAQGAAEQAASLEETSASSEQLTSMTRKNSDNAQHVAGLADQSQKKVEQANQTLEQMVGSMNEITSSSGKISKIIKVIDEIAFQTNILALNAAVEAARAGEAGMGFAVVADEVRNLAQRCAQAAKDTASLIEESIQKSTSGSEHLSHVVAAVSSITQSAAEIKTLAQEVNLGSQEQSRGIDQISRAISQMEAVTQKTAANAEEGAAASEQLSAQANSLRAFSSSLLAIVGRRLSADRVPVHPKPARRTTEQPTRTLVALDRAVGNAGAPAAETATVVSARNAEQEFPLDHDFREF